MNNPLPGPVANSSNFILKALRQHRGELLSGIVVAVATGAIEGFGDWLREQVLQHPLYALFAVLLLGAAAVLLWRYLKPRGHPLLSPPMMLFLVVYCLIFWTAATSNLFSWRTPSDLRGVPAPRAWTELLPAHWGDWRYSVVAKPEDSGPWRIAVILLPQPPGATLERLRLQDYRFIQESVSSGAIGIGVDVSYTGNSASSSTKPASASSLIDKLFCSAVTGRTPPVITAYEMRRKDGREYLPSLKDQLQCLNGTDQGQAMGLVDADGLLRGVPLYWRNWQPDPSDPALSLEVANEVIAAEKGKPLLLPADRFLGILPPSSDSFKVYQSPAELNFIYTNESVLSRRIVIIGSQSPSDKVHTPFGKLPGAQIHAFAVYDLLHGWYIRRCPAYLTALIIFIPCLWILMSSQKLKSWPKLAIEGGIWCAIILIAAALLMRYLYIWADAIYGIAAVCILLPIARIHALSITRNSTSPANVP